MVSVVVVTFNSQDYIVACLDSIYRQSVQDIEVVVIDNGSVDETKELIKRKYGTVRLIENNNNFGACRARNQGIECVAGEWVLTLDSDVILDDNFINGFITYQSQFADDIGMAQPNILNIDGRTIYSNGIILSYWRRFYDADRGREKDEAGMPSRKIIGPCSAAAFYRRRMLEQLKEITGYFDERFFFLVEDTDLAWRAKRYGWRVEFCPGITCRHLGNGSETNHELRQYLSFRNRHIMILKNESIWGRFVVYLISVPYELVRVIYLSIFNKFMWRGNGHFRKAIA